MTIPVLKRRRAVDGPRRKPLLTHSGTRGCGASRGTPGYQPKHTADAAAAPVTGDHRSTFHQDPHATQEWAPVWEGP